MANTQLKETAFTLALKIAARTSLDAKTVLGALAWLWHDSQEAEEDTAPGHQIAEWALLDDPALALPFLREAERLGLLVMVAHEQGFDPDDRWHRVYEIVGNAKHIANIQAYKRGGQVTAAKRWGGVDPEAPPPSPGEDSGRNAHMGVPARGDTPGDSGRGMDAPLQNGREAIAPPTASPSPGYQPDSPSYTSSVQFSSVRKSQLLENPKQSEIPEVGASSSQASADAFSLTPPEANVPRGTCRGRGDALGAIEPFTLEPELVQSLARVSQKTQALWLRTYGSTPEDLKWLVTKLLYIADWRRQNPRRGPQVKGFESWYSNWLEADYRKYQRNIPTNRPSRADELDRRHRDQRQRILDGEL